MTFLVRLRELLVLNVMLGVLLGIAAGAGIADLMMYARGEEVELWAECQACMALVLVLVVAIWGLNVLSARTVSRLVGSAATLRALYFFALYPAMFLLIMLANMEDAFLNVLIFGSPLLLVGAFLLPYYSWVLHSETLSYLRRTTVPRTCYRCQARYLMVRMAVTAPCPWCGFENRNPLATGPGAAGAPSQGGPPLPDSFKAVVGAEVLGEDWVAYFHEGRVGRFLVGGMDLTLLNLSRIFLAIPALAAFWGGLFLVADGIGYYPIFSEELFAGLLLLAGFALSVPGIIRRPRGMWLKPAMAGAGLLVISGIGVGIVLYDWLVPAPFMLCAAIALAMMIAGAWLSYGKPSVVRFGKR